MSKKEQESFLAGLNKAMGNDEAFMRLSTRDKKIVTGLSTGSYLLNYKMSGNPFVGWQYGRIAEVYGPEQSGKTTLTLHTIAEAHKLDAMKGNKQVINPVFIDAEHTLDPDYASAIGVDMDRLYVMQPDSGEQALTGVEKAIDTGSKLIVIDSVASLTPQAELDGDMGDSHMGLQARLMGQALRKLVGKISKNQALVIFINQLRMKIGVMFGNPETTPGGKALKFYSSYRLDVRAARGDAIKGKQSLSNIKADKDENEIGIKTKIKIVKNKLYPPYKRALLPIIYGRGFDKEKDIVKFLELCGYLDDGFELPSLGKTYQKPMFKKVLSKPEVQGDVLAFLKREFVE